MDNCANPWQNQQNECGAGVFEFNVPLTTRSWRWDLGLVSSERLKKQRIEPATLGLQGKHANHCVTAAPTKWMCAQRGLRSAWASAQSGQSSLCAQWVAKDTSFLHADSEDSDQTEWMPRLILVFIGCIWHFVGFVMLWLKCLTHQQGHLSCLRETVV